MSEHDEPSVVDGNAVAGLLSEVFAGDPTMFVGTCRGCGVWSDRAARSRHIEHKHRK